jgi:hypothetical protein
MRTIVPLGTDVGGENVELTGAVVVEGAVATGEGELPGLIGDAVGLVPEVSGSVGLRMTKYQ